MPSLPVAMCSQKARAKEDRIKPVGLKWRAADVHSDFLTGHNFRWKVESMTAGSLGRFFLVCVLG